MSQHAGPMALTHLGDDEQMFRDTVRRFAIEQIGPLVRGMDESQQMDSATPRARTWLRSERSRESRRQRSA